MTFLEQMDFALDLYFKGKAPVLINKNHDLLHGQPMHSMESPVIRDVDIKLEEWKISHWPQTLEAARQVWLKNRAAR